MKSFQPICHTLAAARSLTVPFGLLCLFACAFLSLSVRAADSVGTISGTVSNSATGKLLEGAKITILQLGLTALTDNPLAWGGLRRPAPPRVRHRAKMLRRHA